MVWHRTLDPAGGGATASAGRRVAIGNSSTVAALYVKTVTTFGENGNIQSTVPPKRSFVEDAAVDDDTGSVYVVGFDNKRLSATN